MEIRKEFFEKEIEKIGSLIHEEAKRKLREYIYNAIDMIERGDLGQFIRWYGYIIYYSTELRHRFPASAKEITNITTKILQWLYHLFNAKWKIVKKD